MWIYEVDCVNGTYYEKECEFDETTDYNRGDLHRNENTASSLREELNYVMQRGGVKGWTIC